MRNAAILILAAMTSGLYGFGRMQPHPQMSNPSDWKAVENALGKAGSIQPGDVYKVAFPRSDLRVTVRGVVVKPALALGSWVAFKRMGRETMVMGDLVLAEDEISPVMLKLQEGGIGQTALHNHLLWENPRVMYMHVSGRGDAAKLAAAIHASLALTGTPMSAAVPAGKPEAAPELDPGALNRILGRTGQTNGGVLQYAFPRSEEITEDGMEVPPSMGTATSVNFQPTGGGKAAIAGDFVLSGDEVNPVLRTLRENGIEVTALHSHMLKESPRLFFMHYWANDDAGKLARGLRAALDKTNCAR